MALLNWKNTLGQLWQKRGNICHGPDAPCAQCIPLAESPKNETSSAQALHFVISASGEGLSVKRIHKNPNHFLLVKKKKNPRRPHSGWSAGRPSYKIERDFLRVFVNFQQNSHWDCAPVPHTVTTSTIIASYLHKCSSPADTRLPSQCMAIMTLLL